MSESYPPEFEFNVDPVFEAQFGAVLMERQTGVISYQGAINRLHELLKHELCRKEPIHKALVENMLGVVELQRADFTQARRYFNTAYHIFLQCGDHDRAANALNNIGDTYRQRGTLYEAQTYFQKAYALSKEFNNLELQSCVLTNEAHVCYELGDYERCRDLLTIAEELCKQPWKDPELEHMTHGRMNCACEVYYRSVHLYIQVQDFDAALRHAYEGLKCGLECQSPLNLGLAHRAIAKILSLSSQGQSAADEHYAFALQSFKSIDANAEIARTMLDQGKSMIQQDRKEDAQKVLKQALEIFIHSGMTKDAGLVAEAQLSLI